MTIQSALMLVTWAFLGFGIGYLGLAWQFGAAS